MYIDNIKTYKKEKKERYYCLFKLLENLCFIVVYKHVHTKTFMLIILQKICHIKSHLW